MSPPTGAVPGAGCAVDCGEADPVDCAQTPVARAPVNAASATTLNALISDLITLPPPGSRHTCAAPLDCLDASIRLFGNRWEDYSWLRAKSMRGGAQTGLPISPPKQPDKVSLDMAPV